MAKATNIERILPTKTRERKTERAEERIGEFFLDSGAHSLYNQYVGHNGSITEDMKAHMDAMSPMERFAIRRSIPNVFRSKKTNSYAYYETPEFWNYVDTYCQFVIDYKHAIDYYATVDVLFHPKKSWQVLKYIENEWGLNPVPVIHFNTDIKWVEKHLNAGYTYIGIGGLGQEITKANYYAWADPVFKMLCDKDGMPIVKTHGFAMTAHQLLVRYPWYCMTEEDHTIMTKRGWKSYSQLSVGDMILAYNDGVLQWEAIEAIPNWEVQNIDITRMHGRSFEAHVTHNHEWRVLSTRTYRKPSAKFKKTYELSGADAIPRCGDYHTFPENKYYSDDFVSLVAWYYTEGHIKDRTPKYKKDSIIIYQSEKANPDKCEKIRKVLNRLGESHCEGKPTKRDGLIAWEMYGEYRDRLLEEFPDKKIPFKFIHRLTRSQLKRFVHISIIADGHARNNEAVLLQKHGKNMAVFELACLLLGKSVSHTTASHEMSGIRISKGDQSKKTWAGSLNFDEYKYTGRVWCVQVPSKAFVTKCRNFVYVTGNSVDSASWAKAGAFGRLYIPRQTKGHYNFLAAPYTLNVSQLSPTKHAKGRNICNMSQEEQRVVKNWLKSIDVPFGKNDADGKVVEEGVINYHGSRKIANLKFYETMIDSLPDYPWAFKPTAIKQLGFHK